MSMIYQLNHDLNHITESGVYDAEIIPFPDSRSATFLNPTLDYGAIVLSRIDLCGDVAFLRGRDYPYLGTGLPLMSKRLLLTLLSAGKFPYQPRVLGGSSGELRKRKLRYGYQRTSACPEYR